MSAADLSSSSTPEAAGDAQADSTAAEAGVGEGEGGTGEGQQGSHEEEVVEGGSGSGVPVNKPAPVYNKEGVVVEVTQDVVDAVDKFTPPAGFVRKGSRDKSYMYSVGVYVEHTESRRTDHKYYCLAHSKVLELEGDSLQKRGPQQRQHPPEDSAQHAGDGCSREGGKQAVIHLPLILSFIIIIHLPLILSFIIIIHIVEPSRTQGTKVCKYRSIPGVVTVCSYPTEVTL